jgi:hypothetical protein
VGTAIAHRLIAPHGEASMRIWASIAAGIFLALGVQSFWSLARGFGQGEQSRASVLRRAKTAERPTEDAPILVSGTVRALGAPWKAPLSGVECAGYFYRLWSRSVGSNRRPIEVPVYWGYAWRPFAIDSAAMRYTVLAVPQLEVTASTLSTPDARDRANALVASTPFEAGGMLHDVASAFAIVHEMFANTDGEARRDWKRQDASTDLSALVLEETILPIGATASVYGAWSVDRSAIVSTVDIAAVKVHLGTLDAVKDEATLKGDLPHSVISYVLSAIILTAIGVGIIWGAIRFLPPAA